MVHLKRVVLDVLKPHTPNALEFTTAIAEMKELHAISEIHYKSIRSYMWPPIPYGLTNVRFLFNS